MNCGPREKGKHSETFVEGFAKAFQGHTAINLKHRNLLISIFIEDLVLDIKKQTGEIMY